MEQNKAVRAFSALGQETRLKIFRTLLQEGPEGLPAGRIALMLEVPPSTLSSHLTVLETAGLIESRRDERQIYYSAHILGTRGLLDYLTRDCCRGRPEICSDIGGLGEPSPGTIRQVEGTQIKGTKGAA
ncbi:MAG: ArsR/SmtB family transcription factor [Alphaproteobacteria bacterium]